MHWKAMTSEQRVAAIRDAYRPGCSAADIAQRIDGANRNQIIGYYHRNAEALADRPLVKRNGYASGKTKRKSPNRKPTTARRVPASAHGPAARSLEPSTPPEAAPASLPAPDSLDLPLMDLTAVHCRWVQSLEPARFCGCTVDPGSSYCPFHRSIVYRSADHG